MLRLDATPVPAGPASASAIDPQKAPQTLQAPALSVAALANAELAAIESQALTETIEDLSLMLGGRVRLPIGRDQRSEQIRDRAKLYLLVSHVAVADQPGMDDLLRRFPALEYTEDPFGELSRQGKGRGEIMLMLSQLLASGNLPAETRKRLEKALLEASEDEDWALQLFGTMEFGVTTPKSLEQLKFVYQQASVGNSSLTQWFQRFAQVADRRRTLRALLRTLAYELSIEYAPMLKSHLHSVIHDMRRIHEFFTVDAYAEYVAQRLALPAFDQDAVVAELIAWVEQTWITPDWIGQRLGAMTADPVKRLGCARQFMALVSRLPEACFRDETHRQTILDACLTYAGNEDGDLE